MLCNITPGMVESAYDLLRASSPFRRWGLPPGSEVEFRVMRSRGMFGDYLREGGHHRIRVSAPKHSRMETLLATIAHEMCHMKQFSPACRIAGTGRTRDVAHGAAFKRLAQQVCRHHPMFDIVMF